MIKAVIIEDEKHAVISLQKALKDIHAKVEIEAVLHTVEDAVRWFRDRDTELIFLDIHLGDSTSFSIFDQVKTNAGIIFITAYNEYVLKAFKLNSIDYLLKPIQDEELAFALEKFLKQKSATTQVNIQALLSMLETKPSYQERFMVVAGQKIKSIPVSDIAYITSEGKYAGIVTHHKESYLIDYTLELLENKLDPSLFFRINRQMIVSFRSIKQMYAWTKSRVKLELNPPVETDVIVSIDKSGEFKKWLDR